MLKTLTALAPLALVAGLLTGCNNDDSSTTSAYCTDFKADHAKFEALSGDDIGAMDDTIARIHHLAGEAPAAVAAAWKVVDDAATAMTDALAEAGITFDDLAAIQNGDVPDDVDLTELDELAPKLEVFSGPEVEKAGDEIERHAKDECGVVFTSA